MWELFLWLALAFTLIIFFVRWLTRWAVVIMQRQVEDKLRAAEAVANDGVIPAPWLQPYRQRLATLQQRGGSEVDQARLGRQLQQQCLHQVDGLIRYFQGGAFVDSPYTRDVLIDALQQQRQRWATQEWQTFVALAKEGNQREG
ncbi:MAG: hypothetical protein R3C14_27145 [Caldilineaceae bacterium]